MNWFLLIQLQLITATCPGSSTAHSGLGPSTVINQDICISQADLGNYSIETVISDNSSLCYIVSSSESVR